MEIILEIIIYLLVVLGLITVCFTFFSRFNVIDNIVEKDTREEESEIITYSRNKTQDSKLVLNIRYKNISNDELYKIKEVVGKGKYNDIFDIADEVNYIDSSKKSKK